MKKANKIIYTNIREYLVTRWRARRKSFFTYLFIFIGIIIIGIVWFIVSSDSKSSRHSEPDPCLGLVYILILVVIVIAFASSSFKKKDNNKLPPPPPPPPKEIGAKSAFLSTDEFFCPHCYRAVLTEQIHPLNCPICKTSNYFMNIVDKCIRCNMPLNFLRCPHCKEVIDLLGQPYNPSEIIKKIYEQK